MKSLSKADLYRKLPSVDEIAHRAEIALLLAEHGQPAAMDAIRAVLADLRSQITAGRLDAAGLHLAISDIFSSVDHQLKAAVAWSLTPVINATGVILHTNLGRAPLSEAALERVRDIGRGYSNLELEVASGERGRRDIHVDRLFRKLLGGAEEISTIVVNNNAAAVMLALNTLAEGGGGDRVAGRADRNWRVVSCSRRHGQVERSLREVGTTNRTRLSDYENAIEKRHGCCCECIARISK